ncbi:dihydropyrimidinase isoform X3 [Diorhabda sublineata]|uniref:dihydropyrimidinase isoform X3 n=1 Tax=Diorhabda sublineata TaxID=1163346 RepID=UPI0024E1013C|nr:dihydropyrimidinase isoform X3 [Diorhabda sublineata]XP_056629708.1 dihydropyrimidinase isoform X3 [Diorhabda sublineata]XP_056629709.1 dihydropyrimidinase isoform X3 [Diorhabda sublineata]
MTTPVKKVPIHLQSSQNRLLIKNGTIVNEDETTDEDIYIEDGIIKQMGTNLIIPGGTRVIDARGRYILPGGIDPHTHFDFEFMGTKTADSFYSGTKAAVAGGTTMIIDFVFPKKGESLLDAFYEYRQKADGKVCCDYSLHVVLPHWSTQIKRDMEILTKEHGINSFKMFMAYDFMLNDAELYSAFEQCQNLGAVAQVHAENGSIIAKNAERLVAQGIVGPEGHELSRPEEVEAEAVNRACVIAKQVNAPLYLAQITTDKSAEILKNHISEGNLRAFGEVEVSAIGVDAPIKSNPNFVTSPPIRSNSDVSYKLMNYLASDVLQLTGSDNCTFNKSQKEMGRDDFRKIPNGVNGVEDRMSVIWEKGVNTGILTPCRFVAVTSTNAAKIFNLYPRKGCIAVGSDADIVIWNGNATRTISAQTHRQAVDFNIFEGMTCHGVAEYVIVNGRVCLDDGQLRVVEGYGRFVETPVFPPYVYNPQELDSIKPIREHINDVDLAPKLNKIKLIDDPCPTPTFPDSYVSTPTMRGMRPEGQRNIQESTFSLTEELDPERKSSIRVRNPPGGKSSKFW